MADTIFILRELRADRTATDRTFKVRDDQSCQIRINIHRGRVNKVAIVKDLDIPSVPVQRRS